MSEHAPSSGGSGIGFFIAFFAAVIFFAIMTRGGSTIFPTTDTRTSSSTQTRATSSATLQSDSSVYEAPPVPQPQKLTDAEIERRVADLYYTLDGLREDLRKARLQEPVSPYHGKVTLSSGSTRETDPDREYIMLYANGNSTSSINISNWYLESYVTGETAAIPQGDRVLMKWRSPQYEDIKLLPGEYAYLITGESPLGFSFHENRCTGYFRTERDFTIPPSAYCPNPMDEMLNAEIIDLDDDTCYDFVGRMYSCEVPDEDVIDTTDLTKACRTFLNGYFGYNNCVARHSTDPYFDDVGYWHIYLNQSTNLWRSTREIIQLKDEFDRIVDVIEY